MLIFLVIDFVFPSNLEVLPCSSYNNGWTHTTCKKKNNLNIDYEYEKSFKNLTLAMLT